MKKFQDLRHQQRIHIVQCLFAGDHKSINPLIFPNIDGEGEIQENLTEVQSSAPNEKKISEIISKLKEIDKNIKDKATQFPLEKIGKVDLAILRLAVYELIFEKKEPPKVVIDEAIEIAKLLGGENSPKFINGVLGALYQK